MEEQSCVLLENGRRISAFASQLPFMRGTALTPDPSIKNRQAPCGACRFLVRAAGLEPARRMAMEPKGSVTLVKDFLLAQHHAYVLNFTGYYACETKEIATRDYGLTYGYYYKLSKIVFNA